MASPERADESPQDAGIGLRRRISRFCCGRLSYCRCMAPVSREAAGERAGAPAMRRVPLRDEPDGTPRLQSFAVGGGVAAAGWAAACGARPTITVSRPWPHSRSGGLLGVVQRHGIDDGVALLDVVDRKLVELILQQRRGQLRGGVERQHLRALEIGLGLVQFLSGSGRPRPCGGLPCRWPRRFRRRGRRGCRYCRRTARSDPSTTAIHRPNRPDRASRGLRDRAATTARRRRECG